MMENVRDMLGRVAAGELSVDEAVLMLKKEPFTQAGFDDLGFAKLDTHRKLRQGVAEVIYGAGKTAEQIAGIIEAMKKRGQEIVLITRMAPEKAAQVEKLLTDTLPDCGGFHYHKDAGIGICGNFPAKDGVGRIVVATGGTSDIPVAEEAALTAEALGNEVERLYDVGVAGLHRLVSHMDAIMSARVIIAIAGMEGALASVIGGLADCPVIAVPTSVGYGASFHGVSALLSMLNSCASGISVVNIDNGFGAGYLASMINHLRG
jgi:NCAIR mutase (PurE)-related protein